MKALIALIVFTIAHPAFAGIAHEPVLVSEQELQTRGILIRKTIHQGPVVSVTVQTTVNPTSEDEIFTTQEFVIYESDFSVENLCYLDSHSSDKVTRRERKAQREATFDAFGKEVRRAYLVFVFRLPYKPPMQHYRRYLLPISAIHDEG